MKKICQHIYQFFTSETLKTLYKIVYFISSFILMIYLFGSFISWNSNPLHWWLFTAVGGRIIIVIIVLITIYALNDDDFRKKL